MSIYGARSEIRRKKYIILGVNKYQSEKYIKAQKRVNQIKRFYKHLKVYIIASLLLFWVKFILFDFFTEKGIQDEGFYDWLEWNTIGTPIIWAIGLIIQGVYVFKFKSATWKEIKPKSLKDWETKQLNKFLKEGN